MFFTKEEGSSTLSVNKYNALHDKFVNFINPSLEEKPFKLYWSEIKSPVKRRLAHIELNSTYSEALENIDNFINELKIERIKNRLLLSEKEKIIEAFIIPLYEFRKSIYLKMLNDVHKSMGDLQESTHSSKYKKEINNKYVKLEKECMSQIKDCEESIHDYKQPFCSFLPCVIL